MTSVRLLVKVRSYRQTPVARNTDVMTSVACRLGLRRLFWAVQCGSSGSMWLGPCGSCGLVLVGHVFCRPCGLVLVGHVAWSLWVMWRGPCGSCGLVLVGHVAWSLWVMLLAVHVAWSLWVIFLVGHVAWSFWITCSLPATTPLPSWDDSPTPSPIGDHAGGTGALSIAITGPLRLTNNCP